jgi:hypothetical protein
MCVQKQRVCSFFSCFVSRNKNDCVTILLHINRLSLRFAIRSPNTFLCDGEANLPGGSVKTLTCLSHKVPRLVFISKRFKVATGFVLFLQNKISKHFRGMKGCFMQNYQQTDLQSDIKVWVGDIDIPSLL